MITAWWQRFSLVLKPGLSEETDIATPGMHIFEESTIVACLQFLYENDWHFQTEILQLRDNYWISEKKISERIERPMKF